jgi:hypothetical protein
MQARAGERQWPGRGMGRGLMSDYVIFASDHPVTLRWTATDGATLTQQARLHDVTDSRLVIEVPWREEYHPPTVGFHVTAEAADAKGACLALFQGTVKTIASRQIDIKLDKSMDVVQRRAHPRARLPFAYHSAILSPESDPRYFLTHPLDLSAGGVRMLHRMQLKPGDTFKLFFRPKAGITLSLTAEVVDCMGVPPMDPNSKRPNYVTRAKFLGLTEMHQKFLTRYVGWLLANRN